MKTEKQEGTLQFLGDGLRVQFKDLTMRPAYPSPGIDRARTRSISLSQSV